MRDTAVLSHGYAHALLAYSRNHYKILLAFVMSERVAMGPLVNIILTSRATGNSRHAKSVHLFFSINIDRF